MNTFARLISLLLVLGFFAAQAEAVYNPELGRWIQRDPIGYVDGSSVYQYVRSSPTMFVDPTGLALSIPGDSSERDRFTEALEAMCPDAIINIDDAGNVTLDNEGGCVNTENSDNPAGCECLNQAVNGDKKFRIHSKWNENSKAAYKKSYNREHGLPSNADPSYSTVNKSAPYGIITTDPDDPNSHDIHMPSNANPRFLPGYFPDQSPSPNQVPATDETSLAHELCGHGVGDPNPHDALPNDQQYTNEHDPAVQIENIIRKEMNPDFYGVRDGPGLP